MTDAQLWRLFGKPSPSAEEWIRGKTTEWKQAAEETLLSADLPCDPSSGMSDDDTLRYICRLLQMLLEELAILTDEEDPDASEDLEVLRAAFVRGMAMRGAGPMEASLWFRRGSEEAKRRGLIVSEPSPWESRTYCSLTDTGYMVAEPPDRGTTPPAEWKTALAGLQAWAAKELKGKQRRVVELAIENGGECALSDLAIDSTIDWKTPCDDAFNSIRRALNKKLRKQGWHLGRNDNKARLAKVT